MASVQPDYLSVSLHDGVAVVEILVRELNQPAFAQELGAQLKEFLRSRPSDRVLLDFHNTEYMSSTAFAALFQFAKDTSAAGIRAAVCGMSPDVRIGAQILSLDHYLPFADDVPSGLAALR
jgi:anti-anti-sigma factor